MPILTGSSLSLFLHGKMATERPLYNGLSILVEPFSHIVIYLINNYRSTSSIVVFSVFIIALNSTAETQAFFKKGSCQLLAKVCARSTG